MSGAIASEPRYGFAVTASAELAAIRAVAPGLAFLVPGIGAQGGDLAAVLGSGPAIASPAGGRAGGGLLVNVSRAIAGAAAAGAAATGTAPGTGADVEERLAAAAREWAARTPVVP